MVNKNGTHISVYPNYKDGEEISLAGIARTTTTSDECPSGIRYESIYLEVREEDVNLTLKPLPITTPPLKSENCDALIGQKEDGNFVKGEIMVGFKDNVSINDAQEIIYSLGLNAKNNTSYNTSKFLLVKVPEGTELKWVCVFKQNQLVRDSGKIEFTEVNNKIQVPDCSKGPC